MLSFVIAVISSLALQCQMCTQHSASTAHERVFAFGENLCGEVSNEQFEEDLMGGLRPLPNEGSAGYGPMRSRVGRQLKGLNFGRFLDICRRVLLTGRAPFEFQRVIPARELVRERESLDSMCEDWLFSTEVGPDVLPKEAFAHVASPSPSRRLLWRERWHIAHSEKRAFVELTSEPSAAPVTMTLRLDVIGLDADGGSCEVDSRLYARAQEHVSVLPLGLVEVLCEAHRRYIERLEAALLAIAAQERPEAAPAAAATAGAAVSSGGAFSADAKGSFAANGAAAGAAAARAPDGAPVPAMNLQGFAEKQRPPAWAAQGSRPQGGGAAPGNLDKSFLMQVADGI
eukprot:TRINITY_DN18052_c0_g1_i2.p2 TRINITY_DN18052_c0_g1~~TRINITY_DN18052_c0_g1_i2.p2  ORF type:complete len:343 (-),score=89.75 TRINITY_DN18052_c0_g1_i2:164-1192(-)